MNAVFSCTLFASKSAQTKNARHRRLQRPRAEKPRRRQILHPGKKRVDGTIPSTRFFFSIPICRSRPFPEKAACFSQFPLLVNPYRKNIGKQQHNRRSNRGNPHHREHPFPLHMFDAVQPTRHIDEAQYRKANGHNRTEHAEKEDARPLGAKTVQQRKQNRIEQHAEAQRADGAAEI